MRKIFFYVRCDHPYFELLKMLFYLYKNPPECISDLETVEALILERFQLYSFPDSLQNDTEELNYCDRISHLFMSVIVIDYPQFKDLFMQGEIKIFNEKLKKKNYSEIIKELSETSNYLNSLSQSEEYRILKSVCKNQFQLIQNIIKAILDKSSHSFKSTHQKNCRKYKLTLPFTSLLKLVSKREVEVKNGTVSLSCGLWNEILEVVFQFLLQVELTLIENSEDFRVIFESEDDRVRQIVRRFVSIVSGNLDADKRIIKADEIDENSRYFPPCMANLHQILRQTHRLSYDSRYQYTLFLRDIGVSVDENIFFWKSEYKKPHAGSVCTHHWEENEKRYTYQIEHLYGLIGSHDIKTSHTCEKFVKELQMKMDGGCPFQHLKSEQLKNALPKSFMSMPDVEDILLYSNNGLPQRACGVYLNCIKKVILKQRKNFADDNVNCNKWFYIVSPLQFYNIAKNL